MFDYHKELHYAQTVGIIVQFHGQFDYHKELHYAQTGVGANSNKGLFDYHKELHYAQTAGIRYRRFGVWLP